jgi:hypothetical protein
MLHASQSVVPDCPHWFYIPDVGIDVPHWGPTLVADQPPQYPLLSSLANSNVITPFQAEWLSAHLLDLTHDWPAHPYAKNIGQYTRVIIEIERQQVQAEARRAA